MSDRIDELFAKDGSQRKPRLQLPVILLITGTVTALIGLVCSSVPGGVLVLVGLMRAESERRLIETGALPESARDAVVSVIRMGYAAMGLVVILFILQTLLLCNGTYQRVWGELFYTLRTLIGVG